MTLTLEDIRTKNKIEKYFILNHTILILFYVHFLDSVIEKIFPRLFFLQKDAFCVTNTIRINFNLVG